jgi:hypothetical protein
MATSADPVTVGTIADVSPLITRLGGLPKRSPLSLRAERA